MASTHDIPWWLWLSLARSEPLVIFQYGTGFFSQLHNYVGIYDKIRDSWNSDQELRKVAAYRTRVC